MKKVNKYLIIITFVFFLVFSLGFSITAHAVATAPTFVGSVDYSILGGAAITNTGATSATGDVGVSPGTSIGGGITAGGGTHSNDASAIAAQSDATDVYNDLDIQSCDFGPTGPTDLAGAVLTPGVHCYSSSVQISVGGVLHLDALGDPNAVWIIRTGSTLTTISGASVVFDNVGSACNVFWQVGSSATLGATTDFTGNIIAAHDISLLTGATVDGRILALGVSADGTVALDTNSISGPTCAVPDATLTLVKTITNDNGGARTVTDFPLTATGPTTITGISGAGSITGATVTPGVYTLSETIQSDYTAGSWSCTSGIVVNGLSQITLASGETTICTINNNDIAPQLIVTKVVVNDNTGVKLLSDFPLFIDGGGVTSGVANTTTIGLHTVSETTDSGYSASVWGGDCAADGTITLVLGDLKNCTITNDDIAVVSSSSGGGRSSSPVPPLIDVVKVPSPLALVNGPGPVTYTYTLRNVGKVPVSTITMVGDTCSPITLVSGDINHDAKLDVSETWIYRCVATLKATHTNTVTATGWANGISAVDIASATVVVGIPLVPPLIHVIKIPSSLSLSSGGGVVTYTNRVTNPGVVPLTNVSLTDDKCGPVKFISGDTNGNAKLDITETWIYTCQSMLTQTTTNTVTATALANGFTIRDFAIATVLVSVVPTLPDTGFAPEENDTLLVLSSVLGILLISYLIRKKQIEFI